ncbi:MAG: ABC transporter ATP-binding protein [Burkholderiales bacterium]|nr:ABC transporter ATP-binding protein [Burkholderiales bacterium]
MTVAVSIRGVEKRFGTFKALDGVSLDISEGEFFALLGPNGAGKTTLISALGGLVRPDAGSLAVIGHDVVADYRLARAKLGIVPQEIVFDPFFSVRETLFIQAGYFGIPRTATLTRWIDELLEKLALTSKADNNMRQLSGGMKRRVLVAQALVHRPPVIVLDEPTAGVDVELRQTLWAFVRELNQAGHTILLTTHYLEEAQQLCQRIAMLKQGRVVALERTEHLLSAFSDRVLRVKIEGRLSAELAGRARDGDDGWTEFVLHDLLEVEPLLAALRASGVLVRRMEVTEPDLEEVFLHVMETH